MKHSVVAVVRAELYAEAQEALASAFRLIGGIRDLVRGKTVTIKVNLTGYGQQALTLSAQYTYVVHGSVVQALIGELVYAGARRIRIVESALTRASLEEFAAGFDWYIHGMKNQFPVEFENTRNLGSGKTYARLPVPGGRLFTHFEVNHSYTDTDVLISLAKLKNHRAAGVTLSMKNLIGIPPNSLYGFDAPSEDALGNRMAFHDRANGPVLMPGENGLHIQEKATVRVPRIIADLCAARPIDLAIIEGIYSMSGGEGPWWEPSGELRAVSPAVMLVSRDAVAADATATRVMGYSDPLTTTLPPFHFCENHILMAHQAGLGQGDPASIEVLGERVNSFQTPFAWL